jgi:hypothetical protein
MIQRMIVAVVIIFAVLLLMLPKSDDAAKKKMSSAAMLMCSNNFRKAVAERVSRDAIVELTFNNNCPDLIAALDIDEEGVMTLRGAQNGVTMVLTPVVESGRVRWSCRGKPMEAIPKICRP